MENQTAVLLFYMVILNMNFLNVDPPLKVGTPHLLCLKEKAIPVGTELLMLMSTGCLHKPKTFKHITVRYRPNIALHSLVQL